MDITDISPINTDEDAMLDDINTEDYDRGIDILVDCYDECINMEQHGGANIKQASHIISKIFSADTKRSITRVIRGTIRTTGGISADIATLGAGGDVVVNSIFAVESSLSFINNIRQLVKTLNEAKNLFNKLLKIDHTKTIPLVSKLKLDDGLQAFENKFDTILLDHIKQYGSQMLDKVHQYILDIIDKITTTVSDWIACLFPDTAGLAGEVAKTVLDYVAKHGFTYTYNLISILPNSMQKMITNHYPLRRLIKRAVKFLRNLLKNLNPEQLAKIVAALGMKASNLVSNQFVKKAISLGTTITTNIASIGLRAINIGPKLTLVPKAQDILVYVIDHFVYPNIDTGVTLFYQVFPMFLMFTLFIEKYKAISSGQFIIKNVITTETIPKIEHKKENVTTSTSTTETSETLKELPFAELSNEEILDTMTSTEKKTVSPTSKKKTVSSKTKKKVVTPKSKKKVVTPKLKKKIVTPKKLKKKTFGLNFY